METFRIFAVIILAVLLIANVIASKDRSGILLTIFIMISLCANGFILLGKAYGYNGKSWDEIAHKTKADCEATLPRNQECKVIITASPIEK